MYLEILILSGIAEHGGSAVPATPPAQYTTKELLGVSPVSQTGVFPSLTFNTI